MPTERAEAVAAVLWLRRDLRLLDHPALAAAGAEGPVVALFVLDPALLRPAGAPRVAFLLASLRALERDLRHHGGALTVRSGRPEVEVPRAARELGAASVHVSADSGPYGRARDERVAAALGPVPLVATGSPYAVSPGRLTTAAGRPYQVYSAFARAWRAHGWPGPADSRPGRVEWACLPTEPLPDDPPLPAGMALPEAGERAARRAWARFRRRGLPTYATDRDRLDLDLTSRLSLHLRWGSIHPRTLLADLGPADRRFVDQLAWREHYAAVLAAWPSSARADFHPVPVRWGGTPGRLAAWREGRTGYPLVDAGMRQLRAEGWMHNRARLVTASFLVKDLHLDWRLGARHFLRLLADGDLASNQHGWQWVAGTGPGAAPYHRVLNPVTQARRFDPEGAYVRRWVPELAGLAPPQVLEPWTAPGGPPAGYPLPIVDHATERRRALAARRARR